MFILESRVVVQSNLVIRNFLVTLKLFLNAISSLSVWSKLTIGHWKWFLNANSFLIKTFLITKFDCSKILRFIDCQASRGIFINNRLYLLLQLEGFIWFNGSHLSLHKMHSPPHLDKELPHSAHVLAEWSPQFTVKRHICTNWLIDFGEKNPVIPFSQYWSLTETDFSSFSTFPWISQYINLLMFLIPLLHPCKIGCVENQGEPIYDEKVNILMKPMK